jgi:hypothetical protein
LIIGSLGPEFSVRSRNPAPIPPELRPCALAPAVADHLTARDAEALAGALRKVLAAVVRGRRPETPKVGLVTRGRPCGEEPWGSRFVC